MKNSIKYVIFALSFLLCSILYSANVAAVAVYGEWTANSGSSISITNGQNAELYAYILSGNPPISADISMYDSGGNKVATLQSSSTNENSLESTITVTQANYRNAGVYSITIQASDSKDSSYSTLTLTVNAVSVVVSTISITSSPVTTARKYQTYNYDVEATGGISTLTYSLTTAPTGMTINPATGLIAWTPDSSQAGNFNVAVSVTDGSSTASQSFVLNVPNSAPVLESISDKSAVDGEEFSITASATDSDGDTITYSIDSSDFTQDSNRFTWEPEDDGTFTFTITASDGTLTDSETFEVEVEKLDHELTIKSMTVSKDEVYPGDVLTIELEIKNEGNIDEKDITVTVKMPSLGISTSTNEFDLDQDESVEKTLQLTIPSSAAKGTFTLTATTNYDTASKAITVKEKGAVEVGVTPTTVVEEEKAAGIGTEAIILTAVLLILAISTVIYINKLKRLRSNNYSITERF